MTSKAKEEPEEDSKTKDVPKEDAKAAEDSKSKEEPKEDAKAAEDLSSIRRRSLRSSVCRRSQGRGFEYRGEATLQRFMVSRAK